MAKYRVAQVGLGGRGRVHADAFVDVGDRFELVALCDLDPERLREGGERYGLKALYSDAERMLSEAAPDVFCFVTQPTVRLEMVQLAAEHGVKGLAMEKPMARSLQEAWQIADLCRRHHIKAVVSHQQKYLNSLQKVKETVAAGEIGEVTDVVASSTGSLTDLGTHYMEYMLWVNGGHRVEWVVGHVHGREQLEASHPSPDYFTARMLFANGVRGNLEIGALSPHHMGPKAWTSLDNRLTVHGTHGYVWGDTDSRWGAFTRSSGGEALSGHGPGYDPEEPGMGWRAQEASGLQPPYMREFAAWLDDDGEVHTCNVDQAYHGFEVLQAACLSALEHRRLDLPLAEPSATENLFDRMLRELPEVPPLAS